MTFRYGRVLPCQVRETMVVLCRRFGLLLSLAFWQGGFMFYGGIIIPIGAQALGSESEQGFVTQAVTNYLNAAGLFCLIVWGTVLWFDAPNPSWPHKCCWTLFGSLVLGLILLEAIHVWMDGLLDLRTHSISDEPQFRRPHRIYLAASTVQWAASLLLLGLTLKAWQLADRRVEDSPRRLDS
jgi:hypothetical protein